MDIQDVRRLTLKKGEVLLVTVKMSEYTSAKASNDHIDEVKNTIGEVLKANNMNNSVIVMAEGYKFGVISKEDAFLESV